MDTIRLCFTWLLDSARSLYLWLYESAGWIGISVIGLAVIKRVVNLIRRAHGA